MDEFGDRQLLAKGLVNEGQLQEAEERRKLYGGGVVGNLFALGYLPQYELDAILRRHLAAPRNLEDCGLDLSFLADLALKHALFMGDFGLAELAGKLHLPTAAVEPAVEMLRREKMLEVKGAAELLKSTFRFAVTDAGRVRAGDLMGICRYCGPAPVTLESYKRITELQSLAAFDLRETEVRQAFAHMTLGERLLGRLGPAIGSRQTMLLYGPPGNGKTTIAEAIGKALPGTIHIPYSILVAGQIVNLYDAINHVSIQEERKFGGFDQRWVEIHRPAIITGGELTLDMLNLQFDPISKYYEAPLHMKANNGVFIVDDFGRQQINPQNLIDRWIVNLDRHVDFMALNTGMKFDIPFNQMVVFSTNIEPEKILDEAFLRRLRYKIKIDRPTAEEYEAIFVQVCRKNGIAFDKEVFDYLMENYYARFGISPAACQPRDIIDHIADEARYNRREARMTREAVDHAWQNYFLGQ